MKEYIKIETPFLRDMTGSKKLIEGAWRNEAVEYLKDNPWVFTEKIDGTNISVDWDGHAVSFYGRTEKASIPAPLANFLFATFGGPVNEQMFEQVFANSHVILYGEGYGPKIQNGGNYRDDVSLILFDVYFPEQDLWMRREAVESIAKSFGIDAVPIIFTGTIQDAIDYVKTAPQSRFGTAKMEGLVGRPAVEVRDRRGNRVITKIKVRDFKEG